MIKNELKFQVENDNQKNSKITNKYYVYLLSELKIMGFFVDKFIYKLEITLKNKSTLINSSEIYNIYNIKLMI